MSKCQTETLFDGSVGGPIPLAPDRHAARPVAAGRSRKEAADPADGQLSLLGQMVMSTTVGGPPPAQNRSLQPISSPEMTTSGPAVPLTVAVAIRRVEGWSDLSATHRRDLVSALKAVTKMAGMPASNILLTPDSVRQRVLTVSAAQFGVSRSRLYNIRAMLRFTLRRSGVIDTIYASISQEWQGLLDRLGQQQRQGVVGFARFCTERGVAPPQVSSEILEDFLAHVVERTVKPAPRELASRVRRVWNNACGSSKGWPNHPLTLLSRPVPFVKPLAAFPDSFQAELTAFGNRLTATMLDADVDASEDDDTSSALLTGRKPVRAITAARRQDHARWAASALVASGTPIAEVTGLASLVTPLARAKTIFRRLYEEAGKQPSARGMHAAEVMRIIAKYIVRLPEQDVAQISAWGKPLRLVYKGMTQKNDTRIRQASDPSRELRLLELPDVLMKTAHQLRPSAPRLACFRALVAAAIKLFSRRMLRLTNVSGLRMDRHLQYADPKNRQITSIYIPPEETKNSRLISLPIAPDIARILDEWITDFRPIIAAPDCPYLFPGYRTGNHPITPQALSNAVKRATRNFAGVELSPHQFRHLGAHTFLDEYPGHYVEVQQQLGHASVTTTTKYYSGGESASAARRFDEVILNRGQKLRRKPAAKQPTRHPKASGR